METPSQQLAKHYVVVAESSSVCVDPGDRLVSDAPSLERTADGTLLCAVPWLVRPDNRAVLQFHHSDDSGRSWNRLPAESAFHCGRLIPQGDTLYFLGAGPTRGDGVQIIRSDDMGRSWSDPVELFEGGHYNAGGAYVVRDGTLYWCFGAVNDEGAFNGKGSRTVAIAADFSRDLTDPDAWRRSEYLRYPGTPDSLRRGLNDRPGEPYHDHWLEGNVVQVQGRLRVCWRTRIDGYATAGISAICDLEDDGERLSYRFAQFHPWPGAQNQFNIVRDEREGLFWMTANLPTRSQDTRLAERLATDDSFSGTPGNERRILALLCSFDALNWLPVGYVIVWPLLRQASNYAGLMIDGDDLLVVSRTARDAPNQHDNDLVTFHRVEQFRALAELLKPTQ